MRKKARPGCVTLHLASRARSRNLASTFFCPSLLLTTKCAVPLSFSLYPSHRFRPKSEWPNNKLPFDDVKNSRGDIEERTAAAILFTPFNGAWRRRFQRVRVSRACMSRRIKRDFHCDRERERERGLLSLLSSPLLEVNVPNIARARRSSDDAAFKIR